MRQAVAQEHYLQITDAHFAMPIQPDEEAAEFAAQHGVQSSETEWMTRTGK